jgi:uncharacterized membrane protein YeaQ/YmgE (transglycosylase-associated protein family)
LSKISTLHIKELNIVGGLMNELVSLIITLISGAAGGNAAGSLLSEKNLGALANTIIGALGGTFGDYILKALGILASAGVSSAASATGAANGSEIDLGALIGSIAGSGISGGVITAIITMIKRALEKR